MREQTPVTHSSESHGCGTPILVQDAEDSECMDVTARIVFSGSGGLDGGLFALDCGAMRFPRDREHSGSTEPGS